MVQRIWKDFRVSEPSVAVTKRESSLEKKNSKYKVLIVQINLLFIQIFRGTYSSLSHSRCRAITASVRETIQEIPRKKGKKKRKERKTKKSVYSINTLIINFWCYSFPSLSNSFNPSSQGEVDYHGFLTGNVKPYLRNSRMLEAR